MQYGTVQQRILAFIVDVMILLVAIGILEAVGIPVFDDFRTVDVVVDGATETQTKIEYSVTGIVVTLALIWGYYVGFEVSKYEATPGKIAMALRVTDLEGRRVGVIRSSIRHFAKLLTLATLSIGFFIAVFTRKRQTLHDLIAGCVVISKTK
jgi:uncharacterized RDD family membrane protein YckC